MRWILAVVGLAAAAGIGWLIYDRLGASERARPERGPAAVSVAAVETGPIVERRQYNGSLEAGARFVVSPKVAGRIERLAVDLGDEVRPGQTLVELDDAEFEQAVAAAQAEKAVADARLREARSAGTIADRSLERLTTLRKRGVASETQFDQASAEQLAAAAGVEVARAQARQAQAALEAARIRLGYTRIVARWPGIGPGEDEERAGDPEDVRTVARRMVDAGETVGAGAALLSIVDLDPLVAVVHATERDYGRLRVEQPVELTTDAWPDRRFEGHVRRIAPAFDEGSRQARVEIAVPNPDGALRPGMFARVRVALRRVDDAVIVPVEALTVRDGDDGVFVVDGDPLTARWRPVRVGIKAEDRVQVIGEGVAGRVVTLGQQLIDDGAPVVVPEVPEVRSKAAATP